MKKFIEKWKQGIENVSPYRQVKGQIFSLILLTIGLLYGLVVVFLSHTWWLVIVLFASLLLTFFQGIGILQKFIRLKIQNDLLNSIQEVPEEIVEVKEQ